MDYLYVYRIKKHFKYKRLETCNEKKKLLFIIYLFTTSVSIRLVNCDLNGINKGKRERC